MPLRQRFTALFLLGGLALLLGFGTALQLQMNYYERSHHAALLQTQAVAWSNQVSEIAGSLRAPLDALARASLTGNDWQSQDRAALGKVLERWGGQSVGLRADFLDAAGQLLASSALELSPLPMVDAAWLKGPSGVAGLSQADRNQLLVVASLPLDHPSGWVVVGQPARNALPSVQKLVGAEQAILNLRGRVLDRTAGWHEITVAAGGLAGLFSLREPNVRQLPDHSNADLQWLVISQPLRTPDGRTLGALVALQDASGEETNRQRWWLILMAAGLAFLGLIGGVAWQAIHHLLAPLEVTVKQLETLAGGDTRAPYDDFFDALNDSDADSTQNEARRIARGAAQVRGEMVSLQLLREERSRIRQQQERLIRQQLKGLAENLDEASRIEILTALESPAAGSQQAEHSNQLAELAGILGRLSGLVTDQQSRLLKLLKELRDAMAQQALLLSLQQELEIARRIQASILPATPPQTAAVELASMMIPAKEVGGDFYDYFLLDQHHLGMVIADVSGKGVPAAFFMAISRTLLKAIVTYERSPARAIRHLNDQLSAENEQLMFVTAFYAVLDLQSGELRYVNAGHNPPVLCRANAPAELLPSGQNVALAVMEDMPFEESCLTLAAGDTLFLYTDGVTEAMTHDGELFQERRMLDAMNQRPALVAEVPAHMLSAIRRFEAGSAQADDITCIVLRYCGAVQAVSA